MVFKWCFQTNTKNEIGTSIHQSYVIQRINAIIMKFRVSAKKYMIGAFVKT